MGEGQIELQQLLQEMRFWKVKRVYMVQEVREVQGAAASQRGRGSVGTSSSQRGRIINWRDGTAGEVKQVVHRVMVV